MTLSTTHRAEDAPVAPVAPVAKVAPATAGGTPVRRPVAVLIGQLGCGGSERQLQLFLDACDREAWEPRVYVAGRVPGPFDALTAAGLSVVHLTGRHGASKLWQFRRAVRVQGAQALISWSSWTNVFAWSLAGQRLPRFGSYRSAEFADLPQRMRRWWSLAGYRLLSTVVCNSPETTQELRRRCRSSQQVLFVPNAVEPLTDPERLRRRWRCAFGVPEDAVLVMGIGRLSPAKAFDRFVKAVALVHAQQPVRAIIIGPDPTGRAAGRLQRQIALTGLPPGTIRWVGPVPEAREVVSAADVLLLSSREEGMPNVVLEAMAAGVPVVTTPVGGVSAILTDECEGLIAEHDPAVLADAVLRLVRDPVLRQRMGAQARQRVSADTSPSAVYGSLWAELADAADAAAERRRARSARRTRCADVALCLLSLPVTVPLAALIAAVMLASQGRPVLFHATRVGQAGRHFRVHKFRSMRPGSVAGPGITRADDARTTWTGRLLRRSKLDELPQLVNVLAGDMSLVGPRPEDPRYVDLSWPLQVAVLAARPGLTSPASLVFRDEERLLVGADWERTYREQVLPVKLALDGCYLRRAGLRSYARVLLDTAVVLALPRRRQPAGVGPFDVPEQPS